ncbi:uncharacterized protein I206_106631 [Kwoniella pini CBS 10737]|uniref:DUF985 domain-containing protein n=1 Tax=Kwoniella pini CBS 10737 TaxID=1296096 RepID=A0AAJ8MTC4_9TREE
MPLDSPYPYPVTNTELIKAYSLIKHFEGGHFAQTVLLNSVYPSAPPASHPHVPQSAALEGRTQTATGEGTELLNPATGHIRVEGSQSRTDATQIYYLLTPESYRGRMHMNLHSLFVPGGWWKASEIPDEDLLLLDAPDAREARLNERIGCLISEVVVPGWNPDQHQFIDEDKLKAMWGGKDGWEQYSKYIKAPDGLEYPDK